MQINPISLVAFFCGFIDGGLLLGSLLGQGQSGVLQTLILGGPDENHTEVLLQSSSQITDTLIILKIGLGSGVGEELLVKFGVYRSVVSGIRSPGQGTTRKGTTRNGAT